jgi:hypothetical protein
MTRSLSMLLLLRRHKSPPTSCQQPAAARFGGLVLDQHRRTRNSLSALKDDGAPSGNSRLSTAKRTLPLSNVTVILAPIAVVSTYDQVSP